MRPISILIPLLVVSCAFAQSSFPSPSERELDTQRESLSLVRLLIEELKSQDPSVAALKLGEILRKTARQSIYQVEERWEVHRQAKEALLAIPGHARYFVEYVAAAKARTKAAGVGSHDTERSRVFQTFKLLPSVEVVQALGEYLEDDTDEPPPVQPHQDYSTTPANSTLAADTLLALIENPPVQAHLLANRKADIETWKLWYAQVKAGTRTFKFKGDDKTYRLAGEVSASPEPPPTPPIAESPPPSPAENTPPATNGEPAVPRPPGLPLILSLAVLAAAGVGLLISKRKAKP
ncbi:hypothetical protein [Luteolibacter sp. Populi]|uniref:hypothetical protein n=1 Tax=Luteolibacter sp. Populi TaxID=3230487 RepID=UPI0034677A32